MPRSRASCIFLNGGLMTRSTGCGTTLYRTTVREANIILACACHSNGGTTGPLRVSLNPDSAVADKLWSEPGVSREWRRQVRAPFQCRCDHLAIHRACFDTATPCTSHGGLLRGTNPLASLRKACRELGRTGRPSLPKQLSIAESGLKHAQGRRAAESQSPERIPKIRLRSEHL